MQISKILIEDKIKEKILLKHDVSSLEIKNALLNNPYIIKVKEGRYLAIGYDNRFISIIFEMQKDTAFIITAYPSTNAHRKLYKLKRKM